MGCDIHPIIERMDRSRGEDGEVYWERWRNAGTPDLGRNYELFAALAGVRNYDGIAPVVEPRGLPGVTGIYEDESGFKGSLKDQPCSEFEAYYLRWHGDAHSSSWLTLAEIKAYDTEQVIEDASIVIGRRADGAVLATARSTSAPGPHELVGARRIFEWPGEGRDNPTSWDRLIEEMERVKRPGDTDEDVRLVFFFDN